jgi:hypothetical protein
VSQNISYKSLIGQSNSETVAKLDFLANIEESLLKNKSIRSLASVQVATRGSALRLFSGDDLVLNPSDTRSNLGAAANELHNNQVVKVVSPFSFIQLGSNNVGMSSSVNALLNSSIISTYNLTSVSQFSTISAFSIDSSLVKPVSSFEYLSKRQLPIIKSFSTLDNSNTSELDSFQFFTEVLHKGSVLQLPIQITDNQGHGISDLSFANFYKPLSKVSTVRYDCALLESS